MRSIAKKHEAERAGATADLWVFANCLTQPVLAMILPLIGTGGCSARSVCDDGDRGSLWHPSVACQTPRRVHFHVQLPASRCVCLGKRETRRQLESRKVGMTQLLAESLYRKPARAEATAGDGRAGSSQIRGLEFLSTIYFAPAISAGSNCRNSAMWHSCGASG
jgi:hypothetical protein